MTRFSQLAEQLSVRYWKYLFISMLVLLHFASIRGAGDWWARGVMLAHCGLFIIWQPFLERSRRARWSELALIAVAASAILYGLNWWSLGLWVTMLAGLVGGKVFIYHQRWIRLFHLLVLAYLVALLLLWIVPNSFPVGRQEPVVDLLAIWGLPALFVAMLLMPVEPDRGESQIVDLFHSTMIFLLLIVLVLGTFAFMTIGQISYGAAVTNMALTLGTVLICLSLIWNPRGGFAGLSVFFSRYLLSVGLPFEQWLHFLAEFSRRQNEPIQFIREAAQGLSRLQWVSGGVWAASGEEGEFGTKTAYPVVYETSEFDLTIYSRIRPSPSLIWHFNVLGQLLAQFYVAKQREVKLTQQSYVQAVHETGARLTHDVKNLLQSMNILCSAATQEDGDSVAFHALVRRQLPIITQRLQKTMEKLQRPTIDTGRFVQPEQWWEQLQRTFEHPAVKFEAEDLDQAGPIPRDLFESAADNLINNALEKRRGDATVTVRVKLECRDQVRLSVTDTGKPVRQEIARSLFHGPVPSDTGYGIALYQVFHQAETHGYALRLAANDQGSVRFELNPAPPAVAAA
ncbi:MAG: sensor histidine kinase [Burkholderiales bacterium]